MSTNARYALLVTLLATAASFATPADAADAKAPTIDAVFFAQQHVLPPDSPLFGLVGNLDALIKVQVYSDTAAPAPDVVAILQLAGKMRELPLRGPKLLPKAPTCRPELFKHSYDDSFTAVIPKAWVRTGLKVTIELRTAGDDKGVLGRRVLDKLKIGAPTKLVMTMFDLHYFGEDKGVDHPEGWIGELKSKLPVAELEVRRVRRIIFDELVMPPAGGRPAIRCGSEADYKRQTGIGFDGEQGVALKWNRALKYAAGRYSRRALYYMNIYNVPAGGQGGGFSAVGSARRPGILLHELGHAFSLPHWSYRKDYPYRGPMYGIQASDANAPHAGPTWAFDLRTRKFIPPTVQPGAVGGVVGTWKRDPMQGGGSGDQEKPYIYRHFSDYSVWRIRKYLEDRIVYRNEATGQYARWDRDQGAYANVIANDGVQFPREDDVDVISVLACASAATPKANIVYPPIGPYKAGLIDRFEAESAADRKKAEAVGYADATCNICLRITQGGKTKTYLLPIGVKAGDNPLDPGSFRVSAINLPARDGEVTRAELLYAPDVMAKGLTEKVKVLHTWRR